MSLASKNFSILQEHRQRKTAIAALTIIAVVSGFFLSYQIYIQVTPKIFATSILFLVSLVSIGLVAKCRNYSLVSFISLCGLAIGFILCVITEGGIDGYAAGWMIVYCILSSLIGGPDGVRVSIIFALSAVTTMVIFELYYGDLDNFSPPELRVFESYAHKIGQLISAFFALVTSMNLMRSGDTQLQNTLEQLEAEIIEREQVAEQAIAATRIKNEFLSNISHEIRTPMNGVVGGLKLLSKQRLSEVSRSYVEMANRSAIQLQFIINDMLDVARIDSNNLHLKNVCFSIDQLLDTIEQRMRTRAAQKNIKFTMMRHLCVNSVLADPERIRQVIENLIDNAIKFTQVGSVDVICTLLEHVSPSTSQDLCLNVIIIDTGIGISDKQVDLVMQKFQRIDNSNTRKSKGLGLGLALCKGLVELMHGNLSLKKTHTGGTHCECNLLLKTAVNSLPLQADYFHYFQDIKLLLVDDNEINVELLTAVLENIGINQIVKAYNGQEAVDILRENPNEFDLVFMDCQMPVKDGYEATREIRETLNLHGLPILALTANILPEDRTKCLDVGMNEHIGKPIDEKVIKDAIVRWACPPEHHV